eukprot:Lithocolla_globosa_v1_NODE_4412_length_1441_cov_4.639250.p1 type:complete len:292 gc:universal NODE_4412_length_1441_cov_4.639250:976-101(-)
MGTRVHSCGCGKSYSGQKRSKCPSCQKKDRKAKEKQQPDCYVNWKLQPAESSQQVLATNLFADQIRWQKHLAFMQQIALFQNIPAQVARQPQYYLEEMAGAVLRYEDLEYELPVKRWSIAWRQASNNLSRNKNIGEGISLLDFRFLKRGLSIWWNSLVNAEREYFRKYYSQYQRAAARFERGTIIKSLVIADEVKKLEDKYKPHVINLLLTVLAFSPDEIEMDSQQSTPSTTSSGHEQTDHHHGFRVDSRQNPAYACSHTRSFQYLQSSRRECSVPGNSSRTNPSWCGCIF